MKRSNCINVIRLLTVAGFLVLLSAFRGDKVISGDKAFLIGEYDFICVYKQGVKTEASAVPDKYSLKITKKSEMLVYKNGKKLNKYHFSDIQLDVLDDHQYVMFYQEDQFYPLFYKGDTVVMHITPFEFDDNYFVKRSN
jgi:transposase